MAKVHGAVEEIAKDLVELYSIRQNQKGYAFGPDTYGRKNLKKCSHMRRLMTSLMP